jgi:hypothetical protein
MTERDRGGAGGEEGRAGRDRSVTLGNIRFHKMVSRVFVGSRADDSPEPAYPAFGPA